MVFYLLDTELNVVDVIDSYQSYIWTNRYYAPGDFELCFPASKHLLAIINVDYFIVREDDLTNAMIIHSIEIQTNIDDGNMLIIKGYCLNSLLDRRIIWDQTVLRGNVEEGIRKLITENAISPNDTARIIPFLVLGEVQGFTETLSAQYTGDNLGEVVTDLCKTFRYGYEILLDLEKKQFIFTLYRGVDRSYNQTENPYVVFSNDYENLISSNYALSTDKYKNVVKVAGEGEGLARKYASIGSATGLNRIETYVDARDISSNEGEISDDEYQNLLIERGNEKIAEFVIEENVEGEIEKNYNFTFGVDYFLGDTVEVVNEYGIAMAPTIVEVTESDDGNIDTIIKFES